MKNTLSFSILSLLLLLCSCGGGDGGNYEGLSPEETKAVKYVKSHLERGDKLVDYEITYGTLPAEMLDEPFLKIRNAVYKDGLDIQTNQKRGLTQAVEMSEQRIAAAQEQVKTMVANMQKEIGDKKYLIVMAHVKAAKAVSEEPSSLIAMFDAESGAPEVWQPITAPVQNTVALAVASQNNELKEYALNQNHDFKAMAAKTDNPVLKFILNSRAL